ncbi:KilA-N domain-containing protein [Pseudomonas defluvii]|uniref:KilA-N domain-containing protein n=1 Tax=Pseudomonas defluvii TaxID=1876757 RepID=UPI000811544B|nr:KilA-N domain-containing protein [Pseudomonas defluvii]
MSNELIVCGVTIKQDAEGRYCLNDLHKAAGSEAKHTPGRFTCTESFQGLCEELSRNQDKYPFTSGRGVGTYAVKELVYAYAMWISPKFNLEVIRSYDRLATEGVAVHYKAVEDVLDDPLSYMEKVIAQAKQLKAERDRLAAKNAVMSVQNKVMHDELNLLTVDEYRALTHRYFNHGYKVKLGQAAARVLREQGQEPDQQKRTVRIRGEERIVTVNVYPRAALEQAERELAA